MKRFITIILFCFIAFFLFNSCPGLFKNVEAIIIDNQSDYTIDVFVNDVYENTVAPGNQYEFGAYTNTEHTLECWSGSYHWGPITIILEKGKPYTWTIENLPEPTPEPTGEPTPEPTPLPQANITINNNTDFNVTIYINGLYTEEISSHNNDSYLEEIGNYSLHADPDGISGHWYNYIDLTEEGYTWDLEINTELYPTENCRVFNFENNCEDQLGIDDWDTKANIAYDSTYKKFGSYSLFTSSSTSFLFSSTAWGTVGESVSFGVWIRPEKVDETDVDYNDLAVGDGTTGNDYIILRIHKSSGNWNLIAYVVKDNIPQEFLSATDYLTNGDWNYAAISYNGENNTLYLVSNNNIYSMTPGGTWGSMRDMDLYVYSRNNARLKTYLDELIIAPDQYIDPAVWVQHYNHNVPWGEEYIQ